MGPQLSRTSPSQTRTVGFLGFGRIAKVTLARLVSFGITHCIYASNPLLAARPRARGGARGTSRAELRSARRAGRACAESDVLFVLAPGGDATRHVVDADFLRKMKKHAVLVNTSRGTLVDSDALAQALHEEWIWGAGLDVVEGEPQVGADHPLVKEPRCVRNLLWSRFSFPGKKKFR
jgi:glyoxylate/hydroxypyruvate reductase